MTIPADNIVKVTPGVVGTGGNPLSLNGVALSRNAALVSGGLSGFPDPDTIGAFFGFSSDEYKAGVVYFKGYDISSKKPGTLYFYRANNDAAIAGFLRGGSMAGVTLSQLQALTGTLVVTIGGVTYTSASINLSGAASFSAAAALVQAAFSSPALAGTVTYDALRAAFLVTSTATGAAATISYGSGGISAGLKLTQATGAVLSQGADVATPATTMQGLKAATKNWATFFSLFESNLSERLAYAAWSNGQNQRYAYVEWDDDAVDAEQDDTTSFAQQCKALKYDGSVPNYSPDYLLAALVSGFVASVDYTAPNGNVNFAFLTQAGFAPTVTDEETATLLLLNGYNFYGAYATANDQFNFYYNNQVPGRWSWLQPYAAQIYLNSQLQLAILSFLTAIGSMPYNAAGYASYRQACMDPINEAILNGSIQPGVPLSAAQAAIVNQQAGTKIDDVLSTTGWYLQILPASAQVRGNRGSPPSKLWYTDGGSVQSIDLASIDVM